MNEGGKERKEVGRREKRRRAGNVGAAFLKCNQPGAALLPNVNTGQGGGLTACHSDS